MRMTSSLAVLTFLAFVGEGQSVAEEVGTPANRPAMEKAAMEKAAKKACITGDVGKGIDLLGDLYVDTSDATYVYNQGRCFEQNHRWEEAVDRFREYLRKAPNVNGKDRAEVEGHISDCEVQRAKQTPTLASRDTTPPAKLAATPAPDQRPGSRMRTAGLVTASVGLLALAGGLAFNLQANSLTSDINKLDGWDRGKASRRDTYQTLGWVSYGVGAAALVTGATLFILAGRSGSTADSPPAVSLSPVVLPGLAALSLRGTY
jgi:hypothetical protein